MLPHATYGEVDRHEKARAGTPFGWILSGNPMCTILSGRGEVMPRTLIVVTIILLLLRAA
jgi:hypothetical protein